MTSEIIEKLRELLAGLPITDEARAVYLLVQIRKVFQHDQESASLTPTLQFYCDWALHVQMDRRSTQAFLSAVDPILTLQSATSEQQSEFHDLLTLGTLRRELRLFLVGNSLDTSLCDATDHWNSFLQAYSGIVQDSELVLSGSRPPSGPLNLSVQSVTIKTLPGGVLTEQRPYPMRWRIHYQDGRSGSLSLSSYGLAGATMTVGEILSGEE
jgi:hypothetical protein